MIEKKLLIPIVLCIAVIGILLIILGKGNILVWGVFLLCPLMHLFGHKHSGHNHSDHSHSSSSKHHH